MSSLSSGISSTINQIQANQQAAIQQAQTAQAQAQNAAQAALAISRAQEATKGQLDISKIPVQDQTVMQFVQSESGIDPPVAVLPTVPRLKADYTPQRYNDMVNTTLDDLKYIVDKSSKVYGSEELEIMNKIITMNEKAAMAQYEANQQNSFKQKIMNWFGFLKEQNVLAESDIDFIDKSNKKYVKDFNKNAIKIDRIDGDITTREQIIMLNTKKYEQKDRLIKMMKSIILYLVLMLVPFMLIVLKVIGPGVGFGAIILFGLITAISIIVTYYKDPTLENEENIVKKTQETAKEFVKDLVKDLYPKSSLTKCPSECKRTKESGDEPELPNYDFNQGNEVWLNNSNNTWRNGDIPSIAATEEGMGKLGSEFEPQPYYGADPTTPKYTCRWKHDPKKMTNMNRGLTFTTTIPCEFYPGYETVSKN
jgi:hypothetical protein